MKALCQSCPPLQDYIVKTPAGEPSVNFADPQAVKCCWRILRRYALGYPGRFSARVPGRADYLHYLADLLADDRGGVIPQQATVLDIGTGANLIYPLIGVNITGALPGAKLALRRLPARRRSLMPIA